MLIDRQVGRTSPKARVEYLLFGTKGDRDSDKVDILQGNADLFVELAEKNPYSVKTYNFLISFAESKEELEKKLAEQGKTIERLRSCMRKYFLFFCHSITTQEKI